ncbi:MAG: hypothetical protein ABI870_05725, partial [Rhodanobacter sp.]
MRQEQRRFRRHHDARAGRHGAGTDARRTAGNRIHGPRHGQLCDDTCSVRLGNDADGQQRTGHAGKRFDGRALIQ